MITKTFKKPVLAIFTAMMLVIPTFVEAAVNLIPNPSFEEGSTTPTGWNTSKWTNGETIFRYLDAKTDNDTDPHTGDRAVSIDISNNTVGDAKWYFDDITAEPGNYVFSDFYKSNTNSRVTLRINPKGSACLTAGNGCVYTDIANNLAPTSEWTPVGAQFFLDESAESFTIFHLIENDGWIQLDDYSVEKIADIEITNGIPNQSIEQNFTQAGVATPLGWTPSSWGTNDHTFEYTNEGENGDYSVKVTIADYTDGDAKWKYAPQPVTPGQDFRFSAYYKSNVVPNVVVEFTKTGNDGQLEHHFLGLQRPSSASPDEWQLYQDTFTVPLGAETANVFFYLDQTGWVQTDNYKLEPYEFVGFDRPLISLTFDDGREVNAYNVLPLVNNLGFKVTQCYATKFIDQTYPEGQETPENITRVLAFHDAGHETCSHTVTHPNLTNLNDDDLHREITESRNFLEGLVGVPVPNFASPYGGYDDRVVAALKNVYQAHRSVDEGYNSKDNLDVYRLKVQNMKPDTTLAEFQSWVNKAIETKTWLILVYHDVDSEDKGVSPYGTYTPDFTNQMNWLKTKTNAGDITVATYQAALKEVCVQASEGVCNLEVPNDNGSDDNDDNGDDNNGEDTPTNNNLILNSEFEISDDGITPAGWMIGGWGNNDRTGNYPVTGNKNRGAEMTITSYTDGDAKWFFSPVTVKPNTEYTFSDYYKSNTDSTVTLWYTLAGGTDQYAGFYYVPSSDNVWTPYTTTFTTPENATALSIFHLISSVGTLTVDSYQLHETAPAISEEGTTEPEDPVVPEPEAPTVPEPEDPAEPEEDPVTPVDPETTEPETPVDGPEDEDPTVPVVSEPEVPTEPEIPEVVVPTPEPTPTPATKPSRRRSGGSSRTTTPTTLPTAPAGDLTATSTEETVTDEEVNNADLRQKISVLQSLLKQLQSLKTQLDARRIR